MKSTVVKMYVVDSAKIQAKSHEIGNYTYERTLLEKWLSTEHGIWVYERAWSSLRTHSAYDALHDEFKFAITAQLSSEDHLIHRLKWE